MDLATSLTRQHDGELHVVHAWTVFAEKIFRDRTRSSPQEVAALVRATEHNHRERVQALLRSLDQKPPKCHVHLLKGDAGAIIPQIARNVHADVMVMGTVSRTGEPGLFMGSTAETILRQVHCSVLAVKPDGFVTPVQQSNR